MKTRLKAQKQGGALLGQIKHKLVLTTEPGTNLEDIDQLATKLLLKTGGQPSFKMVPGYFWSTCININDGIVHGVPKGTVKKGDLVTIDVGLFYKGFHTDTSTTFVVGKPNKFQQKFLDTGQKTLKKAIDQAKTGNSIWDISHTIQKNIEAAGYQVIRDLTGHGVGKDLHEDPSIPCFTDRDKSAYPVLKKGQTIAVEVMYTQGDYHLEKSPDNWTLKTRDGSLSAVFEETVIVTNSKPHVITKFLEKNHKIW